MNWSEISSVLIAAFADGGVVIKNVSNSSLSKRNLTRVVPQRNNSTQGDIIAEAGIKNNSRK